MRYRLLGPLEVTRDGDRVPLGGPKQRLVLAHLLIRANHVVSADGLIDEIWGDEPPDAARASLQSYVSHLKKALGPERLVGKPPGYVLHTAPEEVDAAHFQALVTSARRRLRTDPATAAQELRDGLSFWQGEPFADLNTELSLLAEIERLSELRLGAYEELAEAELALGRHADILPEIERLTLENPLRERMFALLMLALYRAGRQADALQAYSRFRGALNDELGLDPSSMVEDLQRRILNQDPALDIHGEPLRGYRLVEQIGSGPLSSVHRAIEPHTGREVAIKVLAARVANDHEFVRRFDADAHRIFRFEHPHAVTIYDWWREPDAAFIVMRLMRGGTLVERLGRVSSADALAWSEQVGAALSAAHRQGVHHGDIRPGNVLFDEDGNAYLSDFAIGYDPAPVEDGTDGDMSGGALASDPTAADVRAFARLVSGVLADLELGASGDALLAVLGLAGSENPGHPATTPTDVVLALRRAMLSPVSAPVTLPGHVGLPPRNPYKGLRAFEEADASDFVGREDLVQQLLARLAEPGDAARLLAVVGPSGSGKSSTVHAGLLPALRANALPGSGQWLVATMAPGARPLEQLERTLLSVAVNAPASLGELFDGEAGLGPAAERVLPDSAELLLVIDQFEELFTLSDHANRGRFLEAIAQTVTGSSSRVRLVVVLRADFYDRALRHEKFGRLLAASTQAVPPLTPEQLDRVVEEPASRAGLRLEQGLSARIMADMSEQPGGLPLLQYALTELWERRDGSRLSIAAYEASGGIAGAVGRRAEQLVSQLDARGREVARQLFLRLVEPGEGTPDTARRVRTSELKSLVPYEGAMDSVAESFARYRLLLFDRDPETREPTIELAHEALLRAWPRLGRWVDEARDDLRSQRRLSAAAEQWLESQRDPSFLLLGNRLEQTEQWAAASTVEISPAERELLEASTAERERLAAEDEERRAREAALEHRAMARLRGLVVVLGLGTMVAAGLSLFALNEGQRAAREARTAAARELAAAAVANLEVDPERSILLALAAIDETRAPDGIVLREAEEALHWALGASRVVLTVPGEGGYIDWAETADLGSVFVTQGIEESGIINVRDAMTGDVLRSWRAHDVDVNDVAFSANGSLLATGGDDGFLKVWNPGDPRLIGSWGDPLAEEVQQVWGPSFSPDGTLVAAAWLPSGIIRVINLETREITVELSNLGDPWRTSFSPDGSRLAIALSGSDHALVLDARTGEELYALDHGNLFDAVWSPDGDWLATVSGDATLRVHDAATGETRFALFGHATTVFDVDWSPDSQRLVTASFDGRAILWEMTVAGPRELMSFASQDLRGGVAGVAFSPSGDRVATAQFLDEAVKIWDVSVAGDAEWATLRTEPDWHVGLGFLPDGRLLYNPVGGSVSTWSSDATSPNLVAEHHEHLVFDIAVSADGGLVASAGSDGAAVWDSTSGSLRFRVEPEKDEPVRAVAWSPVKDILAAAALGGPVLIVDATGETVVVIDPGPRRGIEALAFSSDGRLLAIATREAEGERFDPALQQVVIWDWERETEIAALATSSAGLAFDPTGSRLVTANPDSGSAEMWDVTTATRIAVLTGHSGGVTDVAWDSDPERNWIATASEDGTVRLWDGDSGVRELVLRGHIQDVLKVRFSPDGSQLASASIDGIVRVWALNLDDLVSIARDELTRTLTDAECRELLHLAECPEDTQALGQ